MATLHRAGANHTAEEAEALIARQLLGRCEATGQTFHIGKVTVVARYADCSRFTCPSCGKVHDDRRAWYGPSNRRQGYSIVQPPTITEYGVTL